MLVEHGIPAILFHANAMGGLGELPVVYPEVWIERDLDEERSRIVIKRFEAANETLSRDDDLVCPKCDEANPASFELCWNCSHSLSLP